jgi:hypothetical protein
MVAEITAEVGIEVEIEIETAVIEKSLRLS